MFNKRGFTLIELLIVIAIIAIIAGVVFVALNPLQRFKDARNARRYSEVSSIADAIRLYQFDHQGLLPTGLDSNLKMLGTASSGCDVSCGLVGAGTSTSVFDMTGNVLLLHMNETSWNGNANEVVDSSGNGTNGQAFVGATTVSGGKFDRAGNFDGTNYLGLSKPLSFSSSQSHTFSAWVKPTASLVHPYGLIINGYASTLTLVGQTGGNVKLAYLYASGSRVKYANSVLNLNQWYHLAVVYDASVMKIFFYVNGVPDGIVNISGEAAWANDFRNALIGTWTPTVDRFIGLIDEVSVFNRVLTFQEVLQQAQATQPLGTIINSPGVASSTMSVCLDLSSSLSSQLSSIPQDPSLGTIQKTYYAVNRDNVGRINSQACGAEGINIVASR